MIGPLLSPRLISLLKLKPIKCTYVAQTLRSGWALLKFKLAYVCRYVMKMSLFAKQCFSCWVTINMKHSFWLSHNMQACRLLRGLVSVFSSVQVCTIVCHQAKNQLGRGPPAPTIRTTRKRCSAKDPQGMTVVFVLLSQCHHSDIIATEFNVGYSSIQAWTKMILSSLSWLLPKPGRRPDYAQYHTQNPCFTFASQLSRTRVCIKFKNL